MAEPHPYRNEADLDIMRAILQAGHAADNGTFYVHPGDLNWWWFYSDSQKIFPKSTFLWERDGQATGWALTAYGAMDVYILPELRGTPQAEALYLWAEERITEIAQNSGEVTIETVWVSEHDGILITYLEKRGFTLDETNDLVYNFRTLGEDLPIPTLPPGILSEAWAATTKHPAGRGPVLEHSSQRKNGNPTCKTT